MVVGLLFENFKCVHLKTTCLRALTVVKNEYHLESSKLLYLQISLCSTKWPVEHFINLTIHFQKEFYLEIWCSVHHNSV